MVKELPGRGKNKNRGERWMAAVWMDGFDRRPLMNRKRRGSAEGEGNKKPPGERWSVCFI